MLGYRTEWTAVTGARHQRRVIFYQGREYNTDRRANTKVSPYRETWVFGSSTHRGTLLSTGRTDGVSPWL